jgi:hypothetical protein
MTPRPVAQPACGEFDDLALLRGELAHPAGPVTFGRCHGHGDARGPQFLFGMALPRRRAEPGKGIRCPAELGSRSGRTRRATQPFAIRQPHASLVERPSIGCRGHRPRRARFQ